MRCICRIVLCYCFLCSSRCSRAAAARLHARVRDKPALYGAGYVHDCQKELAEAALTLALVKGDPVPGPPDTPILTSAS